MPTDGQEFDLDAIGFLINEAGKVRNDQDFIFFNNLKSDNGAVEPQAITVLAKAMAMTKKSKSTLPISQLTSAK